MKNITYQAIQYFNQFDFKELSKQIDYNEIESNIYDKARKKYPLAWEVLYELANMQGKSIQIEKETLGSVKEDIKISDEKKMQTVVCNGFTLEFDETLKEIIGEVIADKAYCFYSDSFKMVSRNFEKILHVLQLLLEKDKIFCTCNYYISREYIERREHILKAAHDSKEVIKKLQYEGAPDKIKECIDIMTGEEM